MVANQLQKHTFSHLRASVAVLGGVKKLVDSFGLNDRRRQKKVLKNPACILVLLDDIHCHSLLRLLKVIENL